MNTLSLTVPGEHRSAAAAITSASRQLRRAWLRANVLLRAWSRDTTARHGHLLMALMCLLIAAGFIARLAAGSPATGAALALMGAVALAPELISMSYEKEGED